MKQTIPYLAALLLPSLATLHADEPLPKRGDFIAMGGDSITYMSQYSRFVEMYLLAARPDLDLRVMKIQRGCGGKADEYVRHTLEEELLPAKPNLFTVCFGMNDGGYAAPNPATERKYEAALTKIVELNRANGTTTVLCSPGVVDEFSYRNDGLAAAAKFNQANGTPSETVASSENPSAQIYNRTLAGLRDVAHRVADQERMPFADIHDAMWKVMQSAKAGYGTTWPKLTSFNYPDRQAMLCNDGVHPCLSAHIPMAYAVLKALGFDGNIGSIDVDWTKGQVHTDAAQKATVSGKGRVELESSRLPMCFFEDTIANEGYPSVPVRYVLQHCAFNEELNRYTLRVFGLQNRLIKVTWGDRSQCYTRDQLEVGINLAAEFPENPFNPILRALDSAIYRKQVYERTLFGILNVAVHDKYFPNQKPAEKHEFLRKGLSEFCVWAAKEFPGNQELLDACENIRVRAVEKGETIQLSELARIRQILFERQSEYHAKARALIKPVNHVLKLDPIF